MKIKRHTFLASPQGDGSGQPALPASLFLVK